MQGVHRNQNGVVHALDPHVHAGGHAGEHPGYLVQGDDRRVIAGGAGFVDLRHHAGESLVADGADGDVRLLPQLQGENIGFIHADGHGHADIRGEDYDIRNLFRVLVVQIGHGIHAAGNGGGQAVISLDLQQLKKGFLLFTPLPQQRVIACAGGGILQGEQGGGGIDLLVQGRVHGADGTGVARDGERIVNVQCAASQFRAGSRFYRYGFAVFGAVVRHQNGGGAAHGFLYGAFDLLAVGKNHRYPVAFAQGIGLNVHGHVAVQRNFRQSAMLHHDVLHKLTLLGIDDLHPPRNACGDVAADGIPVGVGDLVVQVFDFPL